MVHFLVDLDDTVRTLLLCDDTIIELREINYTVDLLDKLFVQLSKYQVDKLSVITHGVLSSCLYENGCVAYSTTVDGEILLCSINKDDVCAIKELANKCNISDVTFYDKLGYYLALGRKGVCYVDKHNGMQTLLAVDNGKLTKLSMCTENSLSERIDGFCTDNNLQSICNGDELSDEDNLMFFANAAMVLDDERTVHDLSVFAYACLALCSDACFNFDVLSRATDCILNSKDANTVTTSPQTEILQIDALENSIIAETIKPEKSIVSLFNIKKRKQIDSNKVVVKSKNGEVDRKSTIAMFIGIICFCFTIGIVVENFYLQHKLENTNSEVANVQKVISSTKSTIAAYEYCLDADGNQALALFSDLTDAISSNNGVISNITYHSGVSTIVAQFNSEESAAAFESAAGVTDAQISIVNETENDVPKFVATVQVSK